MLGNARNAGGYWEMLGNGGGMLDNAGECWGCCGMLGRDCWGNAGECLGNAEECWGMLGSVGCWGNAGGMLGENARGMLGECWGILGNARECWGDASFLKFFYNACELVS